MLDWSWMRTCSPDQRNTEKETKTEMGNEKKRIIYGLTAKADYF